MAPSDIILGLGMCAVAALPLLWRRGRPHRLWFAALLVSSSPIWLMPLRVMGSFSAGAGWATALFAAAALWTRYLQVRRSLAS